MRTTVGRGRWRARLRALGAALAAPAVLVWPGTAVAQADGADSSVVTLAGQGPTAYVLISGLVGGVHQFRRLSASLVVAGHRVVIVDPYRLSLDSADVTFDALARRVDALLARHGIDSARVVGHAHGAGVALRLAAGSPARVSALYFLDVGALAEHRTKVFSSSLRFAPLVARMPGGRGFVRRRYVAGVRENAGRDEWLDAATQRAYTEPLLARLAAAVAMVGRLAHARESRSLASVVDSVRAPITIILGDAPHPSAPGDEEFTALAPLGDRLRVGRLAGVGHFPHQEAPEAVAAILLATGRP